MRRITSIFAAGLVAVLACNGPETPDQTVETATYAASLGVDLSKMTKSADGLYSRDLTVGTGDAANDTNYVWVNYEVYKTDGTAVDNGCLHASDCNFRFRLGSAAIFKGWNEGIPGMAVGGVRQLILPPALGYGDQEANGVPAGSVLVFKITMNVIQP